MFNTLRILLVTKSTQDSPSFSLYIIERNKLHLIISMAIFFREPCTSLALWKGILVAAFGNGQLCVYNVTSGKLGATVHAHARWINAIDVAMETGMV